jgi:hypothetical protein
MKYSLILLGLVQLSQQVTYSSTADQEMGATCVAGGEYYCYDQYCETADSSTLSTGDCYNYPYAVYLADLVSDYLVTEAIGNSMVGMEDEDTELWPTTTYDVYWEGLLWLDIWASTYADGYDETWDRACFVWVESVGTGVEGYCQSGSVVVEEMDGEEDVDWDAVEDNDDIQALIDSGDVTLEGGVSADEMTLPWETEDTWATMMSTGASADTFTRADAECDSCMQLGNSGWAQCVFLNTGDADATVIMGYASGEIMKVAAATLFGTAALFNL